MKKSSQLVQYVAKNTGHPPELVSEVFAELARGMFYHTLFSGPVVTPFGTVEQKNGSLTITKQNTQVLQELSQEGSQAALHQRIRQMVTG